jgi:hypothetical protein
MVLKDFAFGNPYMPKRENVDRVLFESFIMVGSHTNNEGK